MTTMWVHELGAQAQPLLDRLRAVLVAQGSVEAQGLLRRARFEQRAKPRMVLTGQFSSGKSTLIKALTDGAVQPLIDADIATDAVTEYPWDGEVILVDTPGVESGRRHHDELALEAIANSDFILFVITVGLFDDASAAYLRHLVHDRQKFEQVIVVITQTSKLSAPPGVRQEAVREALGVLSDQLLPLCEVDSLRYLRSLDDPVRGKGLRVRSRIDELRTTINQMSEQRGHLAQLRQPFQMIRQLCDEAQELFVSDPNERLALGVLSAQRKAVTERRALIETQFMAAESRFKSNCLADVVAFVDSAASLAVDDPDAAAKLADAEKLLVGALERHAGRLGDEVNTLTAVQFDTLAAQIGEIGESNRAAALLRYVGEVAPQAPDGVSASRGGGAYRESGGSQAGWLRDMGGWIKDGQKMWGAGGGAKASSGTLGHKVVLDVGHRFGVKFKPWQAVKVADVVGKAAKAAGWAVTVGLSAYEVLAAERAQLKAQLEEERRHSAFVTQVMSYADAIGVDARRQLASIIDPPLKDFVSHIDELRDRIIDADTARSAGADELRSLAREADRILDRSATQTVVDVTSPEPG